MSRPSRHRLYGQTPVAGQALASGHGSWPSELWQFSSTIGLPLAAKSSAHRVIFVNSEQLSIFTPSKSQARIAFAVPS